MRLAYRENVCYPGDRFFCNTAIAILSFARSRLLRVVTIAVWALVKPACLHADIFQWEYVNPGNPNQGRQQSATLCVDGEGVSGVPGANLASRDLDKAFLTDANLTGASLVGSYLYEADFSRANLVNADLSQAVLRHIDLNGAHVRGASFRDTTALGFDPYELTRTASYQEQDLSQIDLSKNSLALLNLAGQNLTDANLSEAILFGVDLTGAKLAGANFNNARLDGVTLTGTDLANAEIQNVRFGSATLFGLTPAQFYSTASYQAHDLTGVHFIATDLSGWDLAGQNLTNGGFWQCILSGTNLSGADIRGVDLSYTVSRGFTEAQLTATDSYQARDLSGIKFNWNNLGSWNLVGQDLHGATFLNATLNNTNLTGADLRWASLDSSGYATAITTNMIRPDGTVQGLDLAPGQSLTIRDDDGIPALSLAPLAIRIDNQFKLDGGALQIIFEADEWDSVIAFQPGIQVVLDGLLELTFAASVNLDSQVGRSFDLFDWTGVTPTGSFAIDSPYAWNLSKLYTTGEVTLLSAFGPGDANFDERVDGADYVTWADHFLMTGQTYASGDFNGDGVVDGADYIVWSDHFAPVRPAISVVPEPTTFLLASIAAVVIFAVSRRRGRSHQFANGTHDSLSSVLGH